MTQCVSPTALPHAALLRDSCTCLVWGCSSAQLGPAPSWMQPLHVQYQLSAVLLVSLEEVMGSIHQHSTPHILLGLNYRSTLIMLLQENCAVTLQESFP